MTQSNQWLTFANGVTSIRLLLAPLLVWAVARHRVALGAILFFLAVVTDMADGRIARRRGEVSVLGGVLDHATDAFFVSMGLAAYAFRGATPSLLPPVIALAFIQYALDSRALSGRPLRTSRIGRSNGLAYYVLLGLLVLRNALQGDASDSIFLYGLGWVLVVTSLVSMVDRGLAWRATRRAPDWPDGGKEGQSPH
ncbi:CDP-alcohol phosphatidyltransferase family protein [Myxococcota bacterium]|nr:CDP-alcohol phosphatidyltransferase family protein [Myxococcota bacterium]